MGTKRIMGVFSVISFINPLFFVFSTLTFGLPQQKGDDKEFNEYRLRATAFLLKHDFDGAIKFYTKCLEQKPEHIDTLLNRGLAYMESGQEKAGYGDIGKARELIKKALSKKPADARLYYGLANTFRYVRDYKPAILHLEKAVRLDPTRETYRIELEAVKAEQQQAGNH